MTPEEKLKQLAEFAAEFLGAKNNKLKVIDSGMNCQVYEVHSIVISEYDLFYSCIYAPILMHLGKREMEKRDYIYQHEVEKRKWIHQKKKQYRFVHYWKFTKVENFNRNGGFSCVVKDGYGACMRENEFIAFWSALLEAVKL